MTKAKIDYKQLYEQEQQKRQQAETRAKKFQAAADKSLYKKEYRVVSATSHAKATSNDKIASHMHVSVSSDATACLLANANACELVKDIVRADEKLTLIVVDNKIRDELTQACNERIEQLCSDVVL